MKNNCPICNSNLKNYQPSFGPQGINTELFSCPLCGDFLLTSRLASSLLYFFEKNKFNNIKLIHAIRQSYEKDSELHIYDTNTVEKILERPLPNPKEQADLLIRWLGEKIEGPGETVWVEPSTHKSIIGAKSDEGFALVINHLFDDGLIIGKKAPTMGAPERAHITLSFKGWDYYEQLKRGGATYGKAFIAMKFDEPILDKIVDETFKPCVKQAGFELYRLSDIPKAGLIDNKMRVEIQSSDFLIADLTHENQGAYWEAGYAEGLGKPVIYTCEKSKFEKDKTHFDTNHHLTIIWDPANPEAAGEDLKATIRATLPGIAKMED